MPKSKEPGETYRPLIRPIYDSLTDAWELGVATFLKRYHKLPVKVAHLYAAYWCQSEVCNGGIEPVFLQHNRVVGARST